ncbi:hypothetical protein LPJ61_007094, partial [Coemansia biformis]
MAMQLLGMFKDYYLARQLGSGAAPDGAPGAGTGTAVSTLALLWAYAGGLRSAQALHERLVEAVVYAAPRFLDTTPIGRIMVRFAKDVQVVDEDITEILFSCIR